MTKQNNALRLAEQYDYGDPAAHSNTWKVAVCTELRRQHARIAELEAQLESIAASAGSEPVAWQYRSVRNKGMWFDCTEDRAKRRAAHPEAWEVRCLYPHPSTSDGVAGGWMPIETAPKDGTRILLHPAVEVHDAWSKGYWSEQHECWIVGGSASGVTHTYWLPLPPTPPTTPAGSGKGE